MSNIKFPKGEGFKIIKQESEANVNDSWYVLPINSTTAKLIIVDENGGKRTIGNAGQLSGNYIPLSGTTEGNEVTGDVEFAAGVTIKCLNSNGNAYNKAQIDDGGFTVNLDDGGEQVSYGMSVFDFTCDKVLIPNTPKSFVQKYYVDNKHDYSVTERATGGYYEYYDENSVLVKKPVYRKMIYTVYDENASLLLMFPETHHLVLCESIAYFLPGNDLFNLPYYRKDFSNNNEIQISEIITLEDNQLNIFSKSEDTNGLLLGLKFKVIIEYTKTTDTAIPV